MAETQGDRVMRIMAHFNMSQSDLADKLGITQAGVSKMLNAPNISRKAITKITTQFNVSSEWLIRGQGEMFPQKEKPEQKNTAPVMTQEKFWQEMVLSQQKTIENLSQTIYSMQKKVS